MSRAPITAAILTPTSAALVTCSEPRFADADGNENADFITLTFVAVFNGPTQALGDAVTFPRNATQSVKQAAVRDKVNAVLQAYEPTVMLTNANIQIMGLPV